MNPLFNPKGYISSEHVNSYKRMKCTKYTDKEIAVMITSKLINFDSLKYQIVNLKEKTVMWLQYDLEKLLVKEVKFCPLIITISLQDLLGNYKININFDELTKLIIDCLES